ncbi:MULTISPECIES: methyltransferase [Pseudomonas]|jgi:SAM-dependent methyltransferase|uniref:Methyltransferase n=1 Tax=Pseudomonas simiae TaxID=321846 RepID=U1UYR5_9PSED|nr:MULTISPECIES: methyltransferase [Pseudomonas]ERH61423.1 methyltransferase [Pseudomonas simiae]UNK65021.1 class I SAM-dependent methyltransferase [Pseudomonas simiae]WLH99761.1 methyltransferase [Pseudomonas simiae]VVO06359.1 hypothetical protein PS708_03062 [Pseudomonas fluorescens]
MKGLRDFLLDPSLRMLDVDGPERPQLHSRVLERKWALKDVFVEFHHAFHRLVDHYCKVAGLEIESDAGVAPMRNSYPEVLATDVVFGVPLDRMLNALYRQNCFHHFADPALLFTESHRALKPGGGVILIEPRYKLFGAFIYKRLFKSEGFDTSYTSWGASSVGPMNGGNQALTYSGLVRDRHVFDFKFPVLEIAHQEVGDNHLRYLVFGGRSFRQLLSKALIPLIEKIGLLFRLVRKFFALHHVVVMRRMV